MFYLRCVALILWFPATQGLRNVPQYAQDFSEHCKRREALPSVFLSRRVMEADAAVLHFSRLDMPYSCFTTVRTEAGHSIIMVIEVSPDDLNQDFCKEGYQLGVFEYAETFGGYWGPIPDVVLQQDPEDPVYTKKYTLGTKPPPTTTKTTEQTLGVSSAKSSTTSIATAVTQDFITIEVPLVNLSASLVPIEAQDEKPFDVDEFFDVFYDVMPRPGKPYETSILPLVQIAVKKQDGLREGDGEPRYELDYEIGPFTPDHRLTTPAWSSNIKINRNSNRWKKKKLQDKRVEPAITNNSLHTKEPVESRKLKQYTPPATDQRPSYKQVIPQAITEDKYEIEEKEKTTFNFIDDIMKSLNESGDLTTQGQSTNSDVLAIFNTPENGHHNLSGFHHQNSDLMKTGPNGSYIHPINKKKHKSGRYGATKIKKRPILSLSKQYSDHVSTGILRPPVKRKVTCNQSQDGLRHTRNTSQMAYKTISNKRKQNLEHPKNTFEEEFVTKDKNSTATNEMNIVTFSSSTTRARNTNRLIIEASSNPTVGTSAHGDQKISGNLGATQTLANDVLLPVITTERSLSGTLVDHESWENVVQSAPVMAGLLNQHGPELNSSSNFKLSDDMAAKSKRRFRRKRHISAIMVNEARPHSRATTTLAALRASMFNAIDVHEFARLIELPDDQMNNHVTIKMNPEANPQLFNICGANNGSKTRFLVVFNSSRIILSIVNFSMPHIMVALTTARPLALMEQQCPDSLVECQVEGTRLCIDSTNACDGIPNCGSAYAYDEDRVLCGVIDRQRNVYLAAASCLAVLVTMLYIIHYWLRICVPNVAEAFFVYYDSADNELYLDSIMRSPMDVDADQYMYNSALFDEENLLYSNDNRKSINIFKRVFSVFPKINLFKQRRPSNKLSVEEQRIGRSLSAEVPGNTSFTESDLRSMMSTARDQEVQTGESLEMAYLKVINSIKQGASDKKPTKQRLPSVHHIVIRDLLKDKISSSLDTSLDIPGPSAGGADPMPRPGVEEKEIHSTLYAPGTSPIAKPGKMKSSGTTRRARQGQEAVQGKKCLRFNEHTTFIPREEDEDDDPMETEELSTGKQSHKKIDDNNSEHGSDFRNFFRKKKDHK